MKHTVYGISLAALAMAVVAILLGASGKSVRENEIETALNTAIEQALEQITEEGHGAGDDRGLIGDFNQLLLQQVESDSEIQVEILTADVKRGVLDVRITDTYQNILGQERKIVCRKLSFRKRIQRRKDTIRLLLLQMERFTINIPYMKEQGLFCLARRRKAEKSFVTGRSRGKIRNAGWKMNWWKMTLH